METHKCSTILVAVVLVTCALKTCNAEGPDLQEVAESVPDHARFLIFDIRGNVSSKKILEAFGNLKVIYKFKVYGGLRHLLVVDYNQSEAGLDAFYDLEVPGDDFTVHPAEAIIDEAEWFGEEGVEEQGIRRIPDKDLVLLEFTMLEMGQSVSEYETSMERLLTEWKAESNILPGYAFHLTSRFPFKEFAFLSVSADVMDKMLLEASDAVGGPSQQIISATPVINLRD